MGTRLYIGNLTFTTTEDALRQAVERTGAKVTKVDIKIHPGSGRPRGFAFVDLDADADIQAVSATLQGVELDGRPLKVGEAREQQVRSGGYGRSGGSGGGGRFGGGPGGRRGGGGGRRW